MGCSRIIKNRYLTSFVLSGIVLIICTILPITLFGFNYTSHNDSGSIYLGTRVVSNMGINAFYIECADVDGDSLDEIIIIDTSYNLLIYDNQSGNVFDTGYNAVRMSAGDIDDDNNYEIAFTEQTSYDLTIYDNDTNTAFDTGYNSYDLYCHPSLTMFSSRYEIIFEEYSSQNITIFNNFTQSILDSNVSYSSSTVVYMNGITAGYANPDSSPMPTIYFYEKDSRNILEWNMLTLVVSDTGIDGDDPTLSSTHHLECKNMDGDIYEDLIYTGAGGAYSNQILRWHNFYLDEDYFLRYCLPVLDFAVGNVDSDIYPEIVAASNDQLAIFDWQQNGSFWTSSGGWARYVAGGNIDSDSQSDIAISVFGGGLMIYEDHEAPTLDIGTFVSTGNSTGYAGYVASWLVAAGPSFAYFIPDPSGVSSFLGYIHRNDSSELNATIAFTDLDGDLRYEAGLNTAGLEPGTYNVTIFINDTLGYERFYNDSFTFTIESEPELPDPPGPPSLPPIPGFEIGLTIMSVFTLIVVYIYRRRRNTI